MTDRFRVTRHCNGYSPTSKTFYYREQALRYMEEDCIKLVKYYGGKVELEEIQWNVIDFFVSN